VFIVEVVDIVSVDEDAHDDACIHPLAGTS
jgi:hypothetical protein